MEIELGIDNMLDGFLASIEYSSKNGSLTGQLVDCITRLAGKELGHKPWNRGKEFERYCKEIGMKYEMFLYTDEWFVYFPKTSAVVLYSRDGLT